MHYGKLQGPAPRLPHQIVHKIYHINSNQQPKPRPRLASLHLPLSTYKNYKNTLRTMQFSVKPKKRLKRRNTFFVFAVSFEKKKRYLNNAKVGQTSVWTKTSSRNKKKYEHWNWTMGRLVVWAAASVSKRNLNASGQFTVTGWLAQWFMVGWDWVGGGGYDGGATKKRMYWLVLATQHPVLHNIYSPKSFNINKTFLFNFLSFFIFSS